MNLFKWHYIPLKKTLPYFYINHLMKTFTLKRNDCFIYVGINYGLGDFRSLELYTKIYYISKIKLYFYFHTK